MIKGCPKKLIRVFVLPSILKRSLQRRPFPSIAQVVKFSKQIENYIFWLKSILIHFFLFISTSFFSEAFDVLIFLPVAA